MLIHIFGDYISSNSVPFHPYILFTIVYPYILFTAVAFSDCLGGFVLPQNLVHDDAFPPWMDKACLAVMPGS